MKAICIRFPACVLTLGTLALTQLPLAGAEYYTNWAAAHFSDIPAQSSPLSDPDQDGELNVVEFAFGTDPRAPGGIAGAVQPITGGMDGTNDTFAVQILEREGHQPGAQIDLYLSADLENWFRPWWLRTATNSLPSDPAGSIRELFSTQMPGTNAWFVRSAVRLIEGGAEAAKYYVATNGSDSNAGTSTNAPFATLGKAAGLVAAGDLVYLRGGTYAVASKISLTKMANAAQPIRIRAYPGETPVLDCSGEGTGTDGISIGGTYYQIHGLVITNAGHNSIVISGSNNLVELCVSLGARNTGFHITGGNGGTATPSSNLFLNCDSVRNYDAATHGQNADGFTAKWSLGPGNVFSGCRAWENSDDGWDLWMGTQPVLITNCWAFRQGTNIFGDTAWQGNGNGFKLGGNGTATPHRLVNCLSFGNSAWGVDQNNNAAGQTVDQNTVWNNGSGAINLNHLGSQYGTLQSSHVVRNNVAIGAVAIGGTATYPAVQWSNTWQVLPDVNTNDFLSTDYTWAMAPRRDDGSLPETPFLRPVPGGRLVDEGANLGNPFNGAAPDLGAFETPVW
ncbi:MAG: right-handed parallel beta-helix repeat-containing protein [Limisphaerales bacterium]